MVLIYEFEKMNAINQKKIDLKVDKKPIKKLKKNAFTTYKFYKHAKAIGYFAPKQQKPESASFTMAVSMATFKILESKEDWGRKTNGSIYMKTAEILLFELPTDSKCKEYISFCKKVDHSIVILKKNGLFFNKKHTDHNKTYGKDFELRKGSRQEKMDEHFKKKNKNKHHKKVNSLNSKTNTNLQDNCSHNYPNSSSSSKPLTQNFLFTVQEIETILDYINKLHEVNRKDNHLSYESLKNIYKHGNNLIERMVKEVEAIGVIDMYKINGRNSRKVQGKPFVIVHFKYLDENDNIVNKDQKYVKKILLGNRHLTWLYKEACRTMKLPDFKSTKTSIRRLQNLIRYVRGLVEDFVFGLRNFQPTWGNRSKKRNKNEPEPETKLPRFNRTKDLNEIIFNIENPTVEKFYPKKVIEDEMKILEKEFEKELENICYINEDETKEEIKEEVKKEIKEEIKKEIKEEIQEEKPINTGKSLEEIINEMRRKAEEAPKEEPKKVLTSEEIKAEKQAKVLANYKRVMEMWPYYEEMMDYVVRSCDIAKEDLFSSLDPKNIAKIEVTEKELNFVFTGRFPKTEVELNYEDTMYRFLDSKGIKSLIRLSIEKKI